MDRFFDAVQSWTERKLTLRKAKRQYEKDHRSLGREILSWVDALAFAVVVVFLINQFLFQLFVIPSPSMQDTLNINDRVLVSKLTYGTELYPYGPKVFDSHQPDRDDIITFYNPEYESKGTGFNILSKIVYMATFGFWNLEVDENGNPGEWLFVKRTAGKSGDTVTFRDGDAYIKASGTGKYVKESEFRHDNGLSEAPNRTILEEDYTPYYAAARMKGIEAGGASSLPGHLVNDYKDFDPEAFFTDYYCYEAQMFEGQRTVDPTDSKVRSNWTKRTVGLYVPENYILPLGDNRDNSGDGRYFGPVSVKAVTGYVVSTIWPFSRVKSFIKK